MSPPLFSPTTLLLLLLLLGTAPHTVATQPQGDLEADVRLMLEMVRRHLVTAGTVLEDVKHMTMSMEQMTQRMDALETTVAQRMDTLEANEAQRMDSLEKTVGQRMDSLETTVRQRMDSLEKTVGQRMDTLETTVGQRMNSLETTVGQRMDSLETTVKGHIIDMTNQTKKISTEMVKVQGQIANQTKKIEDEIANEMRKDQMDNNVARLLEPMGADLVALREHLLPKDCSDIAKEWNHGSGTYDIFPALEPMHVYCDIEGSEGWTVLQRRVNGPQDFDKGWAEYKKGFGDLEGEHWVGNENMHILTSRRKYRIQIVLEGCNKIGDVLVANYGVFNIGSEITNYQLTVDGFSGNATDGMNGCPSNKNHNGQKFTTKDRDNDLWSDGNYAQIYPGAWWFNGNVYCTHLNRQGYGGGVVLWHNFNTDDYIKCKKTKMRIKPLTS